jgi:hypothetical protein
VTVALAPLFVFGTIAVRSGVNARTVQVTAPLQPPSGELPSGSQVTVLLRP